jgi:hypothetical protein
MIMKSNSNGTLDLDGPKKATESDAKWLICTNQRNLHYILAAGIVMSPRGFEKKYYQDSLGDFPGWIPLFLNAVPKEVIEHSISESSHLIPCIAEIEISSLRGTVMALKSDGSTTKIVHPDGLDDKTCALLIPAPLPTNLLTKIKFLSKEQKSNCEEDALDFENVPLSDFKLEVDERVFNSVSIMAWPPANLLMEDREIPMDCPFAVGGMMAMLHSMGNLGGFGVASSRVAFDSETETAEAISDPILSVLGEWKTIGLSPENIDVTQKLFWGAVDRLIEWRSNGSPGGSLDVILLHLETSGEQLDERAKAALSKLAKDLKDIAGFSDSTVTTLFERHPKSFSRVLILFFLREDCEELLEFRHPLLNETDYLAAAILFAARDGWLRLPMNLRNITDLPNAVPHRMAAMAHRILKNDIDLGPPPKRPVPLLELLAPGARGRTKAQESTALLIAREQKWPCIHTRITLAKGDYDLKLDSRGMHILVPGEVKAVVTEVDHKVFNEFLSQTRLTNKQEQKFFKALAK